ncbi:hypothetical protein D3C86_1930320 [compost metagenome]
MAGTVVGNHAFQIAFGQPFDDAVFDRDGQVIFKVGGQFQLALPVPQRNKNILHDFFGLVEVAGFVCSYDQ